MSGFRDLTNLTIDRYQLMERLGQGGYGAVYAARSLKFGGAEARQAVKVLLPELMPGLTEKKRRSIAEAFRHEAEIQYNIGDHPNLLQVTDYGEFDHQGDKLLYLVMPLKRGNSLAHRLDAPGLLDRDVGLEILRGVASALQYAHDHHVAHGDVKPANVILQRLDTAAGVEEQGFLIDFGIAASVRKGMRGQGVHKVFGPLGTASYLAPERWRGEPLAPPADVYAWGVMAFEVLTNTLPYQPDASADQIRDESERLYAMDKDLFEKHSDAPIPDPRHFNAAIPDGVAKIVTAALSKNPPDRPAAGACGKVLLRHIHRRSSTITRIKLPATEVPMPKVPMPKPKAGLHGQLPSGVPALVWGGRPLWIRSLHAGVGRSPDAQLRNEIVLDPTMATVSKRHIVIATNRDRSRFGIKDQHSSNGTIVNGKRLQPGRAYPLAAESRVTLDTFEFVFRVYEPTDDTVVCPGCKTLDVEGSRFCGECGTQLRADTGA